MKLTLGRVYHVAGVQDREQSCLIPERELKTELAGLPRIELVGDAYNGAVVIVEQLCVRVVHLIDFVKVGLVGKDLVGTIPNDGDAWEISSQGHLGPLRVHFQIDLGHTVSVWLSPLAWKRKISSLL